MVDEQIVRPDLTHHVPVVDREILQPRVRRLDDDFRFVAGRAERAADADDLVADGVAVTERGENLVDARGHYCTTGPDGAAWRTDAAAGTVRLRRAKKPGSGSSGGAGVRDSCSNMSRYLRSMTGHA